MRPELQVPGSQLCAPVHRGRGVWQVCLPDAVWSDGTTNSPGQHVCRMISTALHDALLLCSKHPPHPVVGHAQQPMPQFMPPTSRNHLLPCAAASITATPSPTSCLSPSSLPTPPSSPSFRKRAGQPPADFGAGRTGLKPGGGGGGVGNHPRPDLNSCTLLLGLGPVAPGHTSPCPGSLQGSCWAGGHLHTPQEALSPQPPARGGSLPGPLPEVTWARPLPPRSQAPDPRARLAEAATVAAPRAGAGEEPAPPSPRGAEHRPVPLGGFPHRREPPEKFGSPFQEFGRLF